MQNLNVDSKACVMVGIDLSEWFPVNVGKMDVVRRVRPITAHQNAWL